MGISCLSVACCLSWSKGTSPCKTRGGCDFWGVLILGPVLILGEGLYFWHRECTWVVGLEPSAPRCSLGRFLVDRVFFPVKNVVPCCCLLPFNRRPLPSNRRRLPSKRRALPSDRCRLLCNRCLSVRLRRRPDVPDFFFSMNADFDLTELNKGLWVHQWVQFVAAQVLASGSAVHKGRKEDDWDPAVARNNV